MLVHSESIHQRLMWRKWELGSVPRLAELHQACSASAGEVSQASSVPHFWQVLTYLAGAGVLLQVRQPHCCRLSPFQLLCAGGKQCQLEGLCCCCPWRLQACPEAAWPAAC